jgi:hypothetical protein
MRYRTPTLIRFGRVLRVTLGQGGSEPDTSNSLLG